MRSAAMKACVKVFCGALSTFACLLACGDEAPRSNVAPIPQVQIPEPVVTCGNQRLEDDEECDLGIFNADNAFCTSECRIGYCGDGLVLLGKEGCDDTGNSATCNADCTPAQCGDGVVNEAAGEECDQRGFSDTCTSGCKRYESYAYGGLFECWWAKDRPLHCPGVKPHVQAALGYVTAFDTGSNFVGCLLDELGQLRCFNQDDFVLYDTGPYTALSVSSSQVCTLDPQGRFKCWWLSSGLGEGTVVHDGAFAQIEVSIDRNCGIEQDRSIARCLNLSKGEYRVFERGPYQDIATTWKSHCALRDDGVAHCLFTDAPEIESKVRQAIGGRRFSSVEAEQDVMCLRDDAGETVCWTDDGKDVFTFERPIEKLFVTWKYPCGLTRDGEVVCWSAHDSWMPSSKAGDTDSHYAPASVRIEQ